MVLLLAVKTRLNGEELELKSVNMFKKRHQRCLARSQPGSEL
jgi:hypothetical protein